MAQNNQGCLRDPIWTFIGVVLACITLVFAIFVWFIPNHDALFPPRGSSTTNNVNSTTPAPTFTSVPSNQPSTSTPRQSTLASGPFAGVIWQAIIIGIITGFLASVLMRGRGFGVLGDIFAGIIGAFIGGFIFWLINSSFWYSIIVAFIVSVILIAILHFIARGTVRRTL